jgi:dTDP-glucose 4,6-dehydratase
MSKTILISGAAGFLGSHLCDHFINDGFKVIGVDNFITGDKDNIKHLFNSSNFQFFEHDVTVHLEVKEPVDYILHFASPASPIDYLKIPIHTLKVGSLGTHNLLGLAKAKQARILIASTSEIYGDPLVHPQSEEYYGNVNSIGPRGVYDEAKRFQEAITMAYKRFHGVETRIARIFNTYGPRMRLNDGRVIPTFMGQVLRREDLSVFGKGIQTRSFCYVDDLVNGIIKLLFSEYFLPVNLGNPEEITIIEFAQEILKLTKSNQRICFKPLPLGDPLKRQPDISLAKKELNWRPAVSRSEGMRKTFEYFNNLPKEKLYKKDHKDFSKHIKI